MNAVPSALRALPAVLLLLLTAIAAEAATYYIATEFWVASAGAWFVDKALGNDTSGTGGPTAPYKTVVKAIAIATAGNRVYVKAGNYGTDRPHITKALKFYNWQGAGRARIGKP